MHDLKLLGITRIKVGTICPVCIENSAIRIQKFYTYFIIADIF